MKRTIVLLITLLCLVSFSAFRVHGQEAAILLKSQEVRNQFPEGVVFEAVAETVAPAKIQEIKLEMGVKGSQRLSYVYLEFDRDTTVHGKYLLRTSGAQYKPPGSLIEYRFIIVDSGGRSLETPKETFLYMDNRFQWEEIAEGLVAVYYYGPTSQRAELILKASTGTVTSMGALLGVVPAQPIRVIGYNHPAQMASALPYQPKAVQAELLVQGQAWYEYGVLLMLAGDPQADGVACHELTHMLVSEATREAFVRVPSWLNEGLAEYGNINPGYSYDIVLSEAISQKQLLPLRHMQAMPGKPREILLFYGQARSVVKYLIDTHGQSKIKDLLATLKRGLPINEALKTVYGFDQDGLDNAWRQSLGLPPLETETPKEPAPAARAKSWGFGCASPR